MRQKHEIFEQGLSYIPYPKHMRKMCLPNKIIPNMDIHNYFDKYYYAFISDLKKKNTFDWLKLPRQRYEKSHKWWHSIARGDKYYTNHCLSGMGISFAIWPWIRMVVVNKMFEQMQIFMWYTRDPYTLMKMRFTACSRNLMKTACQMAMIKSWFLFLSKSICLLQNISTQRANLEQAFLNFHRKEALLPRLKQRMRKRSIHSERKVWLCSQVYSAYRHDCQNK